MIVGAHLRNQPQLWPEDFTRFKRGKFNGAVALWEHNPDEVLKLGISPESCVVRLPDSEYTDWSKGYPRKYIVGWSDYVADCLRTITRFYAKGFRVFQLDNEPNLVWKHHGRTEWDWATFMADVLPPIHAAKPKDALLGLTPMSMPSQSPQWINVLYDKKANGLPLERYFDVAISHCYWQAAGDMNADWAGKEHEWLWRKTGMPIYIAEAGNSSIQQTNPPSLEEIRRRQETQYPKYIEALKAFTYVRGVYFFILGGTEIDWKGFLLTDKICDAIGSRVGGGGGGKLPQPN